MRCSMASMALTGHFSFEGGECVHFCPEVNGIAEFTLGDAAQPLVLLAENEGASFVPGCFRDSLRAWRRRCLRV